MTIRVYAACGALSDARLRIDRAARGRFRLPDRKGTVALKIARRLIGGVWLVLLAGSLAWAQTAEVPTDLPSQLSELSLEELADLEIDSVYGASAYAQKTVEAPSSVTIITAEQIRKHAHRSLADILRGVRGFYVTNDRNYSYLGVRGSRDLGTTTRGCCCWSTAIALNDNIFGSALSAPSSRSTSS